ATITRDDKVITLNLLTGEATVNGEAVELDVPAEIISNRTFVPLRFVAQTLGEKVNYDNDTGEIDIGEDEEDEEVDEDTDADVDKEAEEEAADEDTADEEEDTEDAEDVEEEDNDNDAEETTEDDVVQ
ncbi:MAG: copper amine oxidase N-terminal domain-containing protein, partial [Tissierellia bacterium]|nr:copper amine oxidase N-terminal domain-containing protein [Tissierellia bacterium]